MKFEFTEQEINTIFGALIEKPFKDVSELVGSIQKQFEAAQEPQEEIAEDDHTSTEKV